MQEIKQSQSPKQRIEYIDCMRGFTMILVVYHHICLSVLCVSSDLNNLFIQFRMPLFFFISGFMLYSQRNYKEWIRRRLKNRVLNQFLPTFFTGSLFILFTSQDVAFALYDDYKAGYWFTIVLFEIFLFYLCTIIIMDNLGFYKKIRVIIFTFISILCLLLYGLSKNLDFYYSNLLSLFSFRFVLYYTPFLLFGVSCRMYFDKFLHFISNKFVNFLIIFVFILAYCLIDLGVVKVVTGLCGIMIVFNIFQTYKDYFSTGTLIGRNLSYIGQKTLPVYFLHYFLLQGVSFSKEYSAYLQQNWLVEFVVCFILSVLIVYSTLLLEKVIASFNLLHAFMFGPKVKK